MLHIQKTSENQLFADIATSYAQGIKETQENSLSARISRFWESICSCFNLWGKPKPPIPNKVRIINLRELQDLEDTSLVGAMRIVDMKMSALAKSRGIAFQLSYNGYDLETPEDILKIPAEHPERRLDSSGITPGKVTDSEVLEENAFRLYEEVQKIKSRILTAFSMLKSLLGKNADKVIEKNLKKIFPEMLSALNRVLELESELETVPFIALYRKELDEKQARSERLANLSSEDQAFLRRFRESLIDISTFDR